MGPCGAIMRGMFLGLVVLASGCAFGTRTVTLTYPPPAKETGEAMAAPLPVASSGQTLLLLRTFTDARRRTDPRSIGEVRNGWGIPTAEVVADSDVIPWVMDGIETELVANGVRVLREGQQSEPGLPVLSGDVVTVYATAIFAYDGKVIFSVSLRRRDQEILHKVYTGSGGAGLVWAATAKSYGESLTIALQDAARQLATDVAANLQ